MSIMAAPAAFRTATAGSAVRRKSPIMQRYTVVPEETGTTVGMGRVLGDGGWCLHVVDMAVLPQHQRSGVGDAVLTALLQSIRREAPPGALVNLLADPPGRRLYERHGFRLTAPASEGMALIRS